jgi:GNAT superfamily N-acetyltransferase
MTPQGLNIRPLRPDDIPEIVAAFAALGWDKPAHLYERYAAEQDAGERDVPVAFVEGAFAGYLTIVWRSGYPPFRERDIPEIVDFNVLPHLRRRGIGSRLLDEAERRIAARSPVVGLGVGLYADYGAAQRLYVKRGYIPDGRGIVARGVTVSPGTTVVVDDDLALYFTKVLRP